MFKDYGKLRVGCISAAAINLTLAVVVLMMLILSKVSEKPKSDSRKGVYLIIRHLQAVSCQL